MKKSLWLHRLLKEMGFSLLRYMTIFCDNHNCINMMKNHVLNACTKHIELTCHFICDQIKKGSLILEYLESKDQNVDVFTKTMNKVWF
jgi:hypothetical protein